MRKSEKLVFPPSTRNRDAPLICLVAGTWGLIRSKLRSYQPLGFSPRFVRCLPQQPGANTRRLIKVALFNQALRLARDVTFQTTTTTSWLDVLIGEQCRSILADRHPWTNAAQHARSGLPLQVTPARSMAPLSQHASSRRSIHSR